MRDQNVQGTPIQAAAAMTALTYTAPLEREGAGMPGRGVPPTDHGQDPRSPFDRLSDETFVDRWLENQRTADLRRRALAELRTIAQLQAEGLR